MTMSVDENKSTNVRLAMPPAWPVPWPVRAGFRAVGWAVPGLASDWALTLFARPPRPRTGGDALAEAVRGAVATRDGAVVTWSWEQARPDAPTAYLVHGWGGSTRQLSALVPALRARGFRVVGFDAPGHGASGGRSSSIPHFARALAAVVRAGAPARALVAHSLGAAASTLAITDGLPLAPHARAVFLAPLAAPELHFAAYVSSLGLPRRLWPKLRGHAERRFSIRWEDLDIPARARALDIPLLVFHDNDDRRIPVAEGAALAAAWPAARLHTTSGLGHRRLIGHPEVTTAAMEFLVGPPVGRS